MSEKTLIVINAGSSSIKFAAYAANNLRPQLHGAIQRLRHEPFFSISSESISAEQFKNFPASGEHENYIAWLLDALANIFSRHAIEAIGHRVVHGGQNFTTPIKIDAAAINELKRLSPLAPNHQPHNIAAIKAVSQKWPDMAQIACFDTSFHRTQPRMAQLFALPRELSDAGILRYGFHGLSYDYIAGELHRHIDINTRRKVIVAHLGHGASMCAMQDRRSVATTMGFTALDGLMMGSRCGALDPGIILHLMNERHMSSEEVEHLLNFKSGLLGVSGISDDVRTLLESNHPHAKEALDLFAYRAAREIGSLTAALGGLDALIFTAGIGENSPEMRRRICALSAWTELALDEERNRNNVARISADGSKTDVLVIPTDEEVVIAKACQAMI